MNVVEFLEDQDVEFETLLHPPTYTAQDLAAVEHVSGYNVAKPVLVRVDGELMLCVVPAPRRLDLDLVMEATGAGWVELAMEDELVGAFPDCELGAEPPIGRLFGMRTLMDSRLAEDEYLVFQAGTHNQAVRVMMADYRRLAEPEVVALTRSWE